MKKAIIATGLLALSIGSAQAASIINWEFTGGANSPSTNKAHNTMRVGYNSQSLVFDSNNDGVLSHGDKIESVGGYSSLGFDSLLGSPLVGQGYDEIGSNVVTQFSPFGTPAPLGYNSNYVFTFFFDDFMGSYDANVDGFVYNSGTIQFGILSLSDSTGFTTGFHSLFDLEVSFGGPVTSGGVVKQTILGNISQGSLANGAGDAFTLSSDGNGTKSFADWFAQDTEIFFKLDQTVSEGLADTPATTGIVFDNGVALIAANHDGSVTFSVPQPASISILALGLLGLRLAARNRKAKK